MHLLVLSQIREYLNIFFKLLINAYLTYSSFQKENILSPSPNQHAYQALTQKLAYLNDQKFSI